MGRFAVSFVLVNLNSSQWIQRNAKLFRVVSASETSSRSSDITTKNRKQCEDLSN